jgi:DNA-binding MarR family transcriptional regulator
VRERCKGIGLERLKVLLITLVTASGALALSILLLLLASTPEASPIDVIILTLTQGPPNHIPFFFPLASLLFLSLTLASVVGVFYFLIVPEIKTYQMNNSAKAAEIAVEMVMKTLKPEEQKVILVLRAHGGRYLQKYISKEAELSKLKTHRVIARLSERGLVRVTKRGNTNEITLVEWLTQTIHAHNTNSSSAKR